MHKISAVVLWNSCFTPQIPGVIGYNYLENCTSNESLLHLQNAIDFNLNMCNGCLKFKETVPKSYGGLIQLLPI